VHRIDREECLALLAAEPVARIGISLHALPVILPVNFVLTTQPGSSDPVVVIRSNEGTKLDTALHHSIVAVEADGFDPLSHAGWSVLVQGHSRVLDDPDELAWAQELALEPWADHLAARFIVVDAEVISGRRFGPQPPSHPMESGHRW